MRLRTAFLLPGLMALVSACGTPQERCIRAGTEDLRVVNALAAESQAVISRGYAMVETQSYTSEFRRCGWYPPRNPGQPPVPRMCWVDVPTTVSRPVSVNLDEERAKLKSLQRKQRELQKASGPVVAQCRAIHPE